MHSKRILGVLLFSIALSAAPTGEKQVTFMDARGHEVAFVKAERGLSQKEEKASQHARRLSEAAEHSGVVYYKQGIKSSANRYVTSGRIIVRFIDDSSVDPQEFADAYDLEYVRKFGRSEKSFLFINRSSKGDVALSKALLGKGNVKLVSPDWVLPLRLY